MLEIISFGLQTTFWVTTVIGVIIGSASLACKITEQIAVYVITSLIFTGIGLTALLCLAELIYF